MYACIVVGATVMYHARRSSYIKLLKRSMFGRGSIALLARRLVLAS
jgi:hypothetical protein